MLGAPSPAYAQADDPPTENVLFGDAARTLARPQFVAEINVLPLSGLLGSPSLAGRVGLFAPSLRTTFYLGGNTPYDLSELSTESLFSNGDEFDAYLEYLVYAEARYHLSDRRYTGFYTEAGVGYEASEVRPRGRGRDEAGADGLTNTARNAFVGISPGYTAHLFGDLATFTAGARVVFLVGGPDDETVGDVPIDYSWGFLAPELRVGIRL
jgi:hypothetical protein